MGNKEGIRRILGVGIALWIKDGLVLVLQEFPREIAGIRGLVMLLKQVIQ